MREIMTLTTAGPKRPRKAVPAPSDPADVDSLSSSLTSLAWLSKPHCAPILKDAMVFPDASDKHAGASEVMTIDWATCTEYKPPYSYAALIHMALTSSKKPKLALTEIYEYICDHFMYYRVADPGWRNSIRHNLSQNECFVKVSRANDEPGKGGYWAFDHRYDDLFEDGVYKKPRRKAVAAKRPAVQLSPPAHHHNHHHSRPSRRAPKHSIRTPPPYLYSGSDDEGGSHESDLMEADWESLIGKEDITLGNELLAESATSSSHSTINHASLLMDLANGVGKPDLDHGHLWQFDGAMQTPSGAISLNGSFSALLRESFQASIARDITGALEDAPHIIASEIDFSSAPMPSDWLPGGVTH